MSTTRLMFKRYRGNFACGSKQSYLSGYPYGCQDVITEPLTELEKRLFISRSQSIRVSRYGFIRLISFRHRIYYSFCDNVTDDDILNFINN